ncbi:ATP-binding protein [Jannaschia helgolandensis]|jgi:two-component system osmolarity sensor histidine kinase EnvZ|uniref:ATP-binding protein n=1 Tax=Jannaschia helgolandensis TaxID=188906 RepID=UPI0030D9916D|tara:strand:- start:652 stop:1959 length:1308 start_codon:yes stop_codon:yes gene_type:complete
MYTPLDPSGLDRPGHDPVRSDPYRSSLLRRWLPRSFYARAALILIVPVVAIQLAVAVMFLQRHYEDATVQMTSNMAREITLVRSRPELGEPLEIAFVDPPDAMMTRFWDLSGRAMRDTLMSRFPDLVTIDTRTDRKKVRLGFADGTGLMFSRNEVSTANPHQLLVLMFGTAILMTAVSFLFMRGQIRPIRRLARAAQAFGRGQMTDYRPSGATEVRAAGMAFLDMRARIDRHIEQRTLLLSGVSHDLRTPLTRMKLELSMMDSAEAQALADDVDAMERIIDTFLDFARESATDERTRTEVLSLVREAVAMAAPGRDLRVTGIPVEADIFPDGMRRAVANLVKNALRYGVEVRVSMQLATSSIVIVVEDDGPGIARKDHMEAMRPFARLDAARSNTSGNVGLGLSIVRDVARAHGGALRLGVSDLGGLKAEIVVPR